MTNARLSAPRAGGGQARAQGDENFFKKNTEVRGGVAGARGGPAAGARGSAASLRRQ